MSAPMTAPSVREVFVSALASLAAAISILERTPQAKKAMASDTMFAIALDDYRKALEAGRQALATPPAPTPSGALPPDRYRLVNYLERLPTKTRLFNGEAVDVVEPQYVLASDRDDIVRLLTALLPDAAATGAVRTLSIDYTNYRGETATRNIIPRSVRFGSTEWHPEEQWLLLAWDNDKRADREFALKDFGPSAAAIRAAAFEEAAKIAKAKYADPAWAPTYHIASEGIAAAICVAVNAGGVK